MKEFFAIAFAIMMLFGFGLGIDAEDSVDLPIWVDSMLHPVYGSAVDLTCEPLFRFAKIYLLPLYEHLLPLHKR